MFKDAKHARRVSEIKVEIIKIIYNNIEDVAKADKFYFNLEKEGFFIKPASVKYHNNFTGGLALHCLNVYYNLYELCNKILNSSMNQFLRERITLIAFGHDLCKLDDYVYREDFGWTYDVKKEGHAVRSLQKLSSWDVDFDVTVCQCIKYHMGAFEKNEYTWDELSKANDEYPLSLLTHIADNMDAHSIIVDR